jgi:hypothetical protein
MPRPYLGSPLPASAPRRTYGVGRREAMPPSAGAAGGDADTPLGALVGLAVDVVDGRAAGSESGLHDPTLGA